MSLFFCIFLFRSVSASHLARGVFWEYCWGSTLLHKDDLPFQGDLSDMPDARQNGETSHIGGLKQRIDWDLQCAFVLQWFHKIHKDVVFLLVATSFVLFCFIFPLDLLPAGVFPFFSPSFQSFPSTKYVLSRRALSAFRMSSPPSRMLSQRN